MSKIFTIRCDICYTGRSHFTWFLFASYHFNATWKFTPLFKFTQ